MILYGFVNLVRKTKLVSFVMNAFKIRKGNMKGMKSTSITVKQVGAVTVVTRVHGMRKDFATSMEKT